MYLDLDRGPATITTVGRIGAVTSMTSDSIQLLSAAQRTAALQAGPRPAAHTGLSPFAKPWEYYVARDYPRALKEWAALLDSRREKSFIYAERARIFYQLESYDSAAAQLTQALVAWRADDNDYVAAIFDSRAIYEYSLGLVFERMGRADSARSAFQRSLAADSLDAAPHVRLSALDLASGDTAGALRELAAGAAAQPQDPLTGYLYGSMLVRAGRDSLSVAELKRTAALDPWYAAPCILLALIYDAEGSKPEATTQFKAFISIASQRNGLLPRARERLAALTAAPPVPGTSASAKAVRCASCPTLSPARIALLARAGHSPVTTRVSKFSTFSPTPPAAERRLR